MKLNKFFLIVLMLIATSASVAAQNDSEREVRRLERAWLDAYEQRDSKSMDEIVADDFTITFPDGTVQTKPQIIKSLNAARAGSTPPPKFYTEEVQARVYGDAAILTGRVTAEWRQNGNTAKEQNRYTDTYVKRGGRWQVVASHLSNAPKMQNPKPEVSSNAGAGRSANKNAVVSLKNPSVRLEVVEELKNVGILNFPLKNVARVERYIYAGHDAGKRIERLFIAQFESFLPNAAGSYKFQIVNPTKIGDFDYQTDVGVFNFAERIAANPGAEAEYTKALLDKNGLRADDDFLVARYARVTSDDRRSELILFYLENLNDLGLTRADLEPKDQRPPRVEKLLRDFTDRALASFKITDRDQ
ncbi:MAG TPA: nuclear transport factor 2 family protein [Pyrinomonadaceae bacterium]|jgi:uncharacterized protein (TIGR02246 family)